MNHLSVARDLLAQGFTKQSLAQDAIGGGVTWDNPHAVSFCIVGALLRAVGSKKPTDALVKCVNVLADRLPYDDRPPDVRTENADQFGRLVRYNNHPDTKQADILRLFDD